MMYVHFATLHFCDSCVVSRVKSGESGYTNESPGSREMHKLLDVIRRRIEEEIVEYCSEMQELLYKSLQNEANNEGRVSLFKMRGDYYRYVAEISVGESLNKNVELAHDSYKSSYILAKETLSPLNDTRLGLALNFGVFFFEIVKNSERAIFMSKEAYRAGRGYKHCSLMCCCFTGVASVCSIAKR